MSIATHERIVFEPLAPDVEAPRRSTEQSAGYDVRAHLTRGSLKIHRAAVGRVVEEPADEVDGMFSMTLEPADRALVPTGFRARLPDGFEAQIRMRSSLAWKRGLIVPNAPGTVDADYPDEWFVLVLNASSRPIRIEHGERIAQIVLHRFQTADWEEGDVRVTTDRIGGLGSTGRTGRMVKPNAGKDALALKGNDPVNAALHIALDVMLILAFVIAGRRRIA